MDETNKMSTETPRFGDYILPRGRQPIIDNLLYDELGQAVLAQFNERFRGVENIEDTHEYQPEEPISFSNMPRALGMAGILMKETGGRIAPPILIKLSNIGMQSLIKQKLMLIL